MAILIWTIREKRTLKKQKETDPSPTKRQKKKIQKVSCRHMFLIVVGIFFKLDQPF